MPSVASGGTADRIAARILFKVPRAGSGMPARYSSTFFGARVVFAADLRLPDFTFFMRAMLQEAPISSPSLRPSRPLNRLQRDGNQHRKPTPVATGRERFSRQPWRPPIHIYDSRQPMPFPMGLVPSQ